MPRNFTMLQKGWKPSVCMWWAINKLKWLVNTHVIFPSDFRAITHKLRKLFKSTYCRNKRMLWNAGTWQLHSVIAAGIRTCQNRDLTATNPFANLERRTSRSKGIAVGMGGRIGKWWEKICQGRIVRHKTSCSILHPPPNTGSTGEVHSTSNSRGSGGLP